MADLPICDNLRPTPLDQSFKVPHPRSRISLIFPEMGENTCVTRSQAILVAETCSSSRRELWDASRKMVNVFLLGVIEALEFSKVWMRMERQISPY
jgi:hypothetical protein